MLNIVVEIPKFLSDLARLEQLLKDDDFLDLGMFIDQYLFSIFIIPLNSITDEF